MSSDQTQSAIDELMEQIRRNDSHQEEFHQAVEEVLVSVMPWYLEQEDLRRCRVVERLVEPDRVISFRVAHLGDDGIQIHRAWRVQFNNALGPYKGGLRFHPTVDESVLKFLAFEQIFKNSLTGLPMGGAKGGSTFDPRGKSDDEVMRFCQSMMLELHRHIGENVDVPAGDIGVGEREISYLFGQYMRIENRWEGTLTGKRLSYGGSRLRTEATGYGCLYFCELMLEKHGHSLEDLRVAISGSGNVALYAAEKAIAQGAKVISLSDSDGTLSIPDGLRSDDLESVKDLKQERRGRISEAEAEIDGSKFLEDDVPWGLECDIAMPCATQNELDEDHARTLVDQGVVAVCEGANMPLTAAAAEVMAEHEVLHAPGKASNAGGVAVSGLEQSQNSMRLNWSREEVDDRLREIMRKIHDRCVEEGEREHGPVDYVRGANLSGFKRVADAMRAYGVT